MTKFFHVSDLHFHKDAKENEKSIALLRKIKKAWEKKPEKEKWYLIITGDLVNNGHLQNYMQALPELQFFKDNLLLVPGNHEYVDGSVLGGIPGFGFDEASAKYYDTFVEPFKYHFSFYPHVSCWTPDLGAKPLFIGLNSCHMHDTYDPFPPSKQPKPPFYAWGACGIIGKAQLDDLESILKKNSNKRPVILAMHHVPVDIPLLPWQYLSDRNALWKIIKKYKVDLVAFGHDGAMPDDIYSDKFKGSRFFETQKKQNLFRNMEVLKRDGVYVLDANRSVADQAYYCFEADDTSISEPKKIAV